MRIERGQPLRLQLAESVQRKKQWFPTLIGKGRGKKLPHRVKVVRSGPRASRRDDARGNRGKKKKLFFLGVDGFLQPRVLLEGDREKLPGHEGEQWV